MTSRTNTANNMKKAVESGDDKIYNTSLGIDIGSMYIRSVVTKNNKIIKRYKIGSEGVENGLITDVLAVEEKLSTLINKIEKDFRPFPDKVTIGVSTLEHNSIESNISVFTRRSDGLITEDDMSYAIEEAKRRLDLNKNKIILHSSIIKAYLDDAEIVGSPIGMNGYKIDLRILFIVDNIKIINDLNNIFNSLKIVISDIVSGPLAESLLGLNKKDKRLGSAIVNVGSHNTTLVVYENNNPILCKIIKIGGESITNDLAISLRVSHQEAEDIKQGEIISDYSRRRIEEITESRYDNIGSKINEELAYINREGSLPAGVYILGGATRQNKIDQFLKHRLRLPVSFVRNNKSEMFDFEYDEYLRAYATTLLSDNEIKQNKGLAALTKLTNILKQALRKYLP
jgi:cell division protein FtsA